MRLLSRMLHVALEHAQGGRELSSRRIAAYSQTLAKIDRDQVEAQKNLSVFKAMLEQRKAH
jgi:hypothetical protein